jgi:hypothetical protein
VPDAKTLGRQARPLGPEVIKQIHGSAGWGSVPDFWNTQEIQQKKQKVLYPKGDS